MKGGLILTAGRVRSKKKTNREKKTRKNPAPPKTHHETHISPVTATSLRQRAMKRFPRVSPCSQASKDSGFVEIGPVQRSQSAKTTTVSHIHTQTRG